MNSAYKVRISNLTSHPYIYQIFSYSYYLTSKVDHMRITVKESSEYGMKNTHPAISYFILIMENQCVAVRYWQKCTHLAY